MISVKNVCKSFGPLQALEDISFHITHGEIVGLVGKNGAGKTTLMRILTSFYQASSGTVLIDDLNVSQNSLATRKKIGYLPETPPLYLDMSVNDYLLFAAEIKGIAANKRRGRFDQVLQECQLESVLLKTIGTLSKGYKQRVGIAQAIIHEPDILILDEPTSGLDPIQNLQLRNLIKDLKDRRTVILSTHNLAEVEQIAQRVLIMQQGRIIVDEQLKVLLESHAADQAEQTSLEDVFLHYHRDQPGMVQLG